MATIDEREGVVWGVGDRDRQRQASQGDQDGTEGQPRVAARLPTTNPVISMTHHTARSMSPYPKPAIAPYPHDEPLQEPLDGPANRLGARKIVGSAATPMT